MLNYLPVGGGVSSMLSPKTITFGEALHYKLHLGMTIGRYFQVQENEYPSNSPVSHTNGAMFLGPSVNEQ